MEIQHQQDDAGGEFFVEENGERVAEMTYSRDAETITIRHTEVDRKLEGRGVGRKLVAAAVEWARANRARVHPVCSFARAVFDRTPDFNDVRK